MDIERLLGKCFLFRDLTSAQLKTLASIAVDEHFHKGEQVFSDGGDGTAMFLIDMGSVAVEKNGKELARLGSGSHFGELALLDNNKRSATVHSLERTHVLKLPREKFQALLEADPVLAVPLYRAFCRYLAARLRATNEQTAFLSERLER